MLFCPAKSLIAVAMPSTGSTFLADCLRLLCGAEYREGGEVDQHIPAHRLANADREGFRVVGTIRNPLTWYASAYAHAMRGQTGAYLSEAATVAALEAIEAYGGGSTAWPDVLYGMTHPWELETLPRSLALLGGCYGGAVADTVRASRAGVWSWVTTLYYAPASPASGLTDGEDRRAADVLLHQESLVHEMADLLDIPAGRLLTVAKRVHRTEPPPEVTDEHRGWIRAADARFAAQFGYEV